MLDLPEHAHSSWWIVWVCVYLRVHPSATASWIYDPQQGEAIDPSWRSLLATALTSMCRLMWLAKKKQEEVNNKAADTHCLYFKQKR